MSLPMNYRCENPNCGNFGVLFDPHFRQHTCPRCGWTEKTDLRPLVLEYHRARNSTYSGRFAIAKRKGRNENGDQKT